jgi:hypothetical protein
MAMERSTVVGVFNDRASAERAVDELHRLGFNDDQIGFMWKGGPDDGVRGARDLTDDNNNKAAETAATGAAVGGAVGGALTAVAALAIPGVGPVLAGGLLASIIGGAAAGGAVGGLVGMFTGMGIPDEEAHYYEGEFNQGRILVTVRAGSRYMEARDALRHAGAWDVESRRAA